MPDGNPIRVGRDNIASAPGAETILRRDENSTSTDPVFTVRTPVGGDAIQGEASDGSGLIGISTVGTGVNAFSNNGTGVEGRSGGIGILSALQGGVGVAGRSTASNGVGVFGESTLGGHGAGVFGEGPRAGAFIGNVDVSGNLIVSGTITGNKNFQIDHPLDPENRYLLHTCVESSERKNIYDGLAQLDEEGTAWVELPEWFETLNGDFRYQLTAVGQAAPNLHVAEEFSENRFKIAGGEGGMKVCWQLTGSRKDPWAKANPFEVEQEKPEEEQGRYLEPSLYDAPEEQRVGIRPIVEARGQTDESRRQVEKQRRRMERQEEAPPEST